MRLVSNPGIFASLGLLSAGDDAAGDDGAAGAAGFESGLGVAAPLLAAGLVGSAAGACCANPALAHRHTHTKKMADDLEALRKDCHFTINLLTAGYLKFDQRV